MPKNMYSTIQALVEQIDGSIALRDLSDPIHWSDIDQIGTEIAQRQHNKYWIKENTKILIFYLDPFKRFCKGLTEHIWQQSEIIFGNPSKISEYATLYTGMVSQANNELCGIIPYNDSGGPSHYAPWIHYIEKLYATAVKSTSPNLGIQLVEIKDSNHLQQVNWFRNRFTLNGEIAVSANVSSEAKKHFFNRICNLIENNPRLSKSIRNALDIEYLAIDNLANFPAVGSPFSSS
jgi:hypothetical protein